MTGETVEALRDRLAGVIDDEVEQCMPDPTRSEVQRSCERAADAVLDMLREAGLLAVAPKARIEALCRLLESEGHMTPVATMQIVKLWEVP